MPGVFRPQTLSDVLNGIQQQAIGNTDTAVSGVGTFAEVDEAMTASDTVSLTASPAVPGWGAGEWGSFSWG